MEPADMALKTKLVQLRLNVERTDTILASGKYEVIERHQVALKTTISEVNHHKLAVEAQKIAQEQDVTEIGKWITEIDKKMSEADHEVSRLQEWREEHKRKSEEKQHEEQLKLERELHEVRMKFQSELQASKVGPEPHPKSQTTNNSPQAKLPKLKITEFNGSYQDWPRFWSQYIETIDKTGIPSVTKFAYLRELLEPKVRRTVEALPFTSEGYNRAKSILQDKYGNEAEIIKAYTSQIFDLPTITNVNVRKIHEFSDRLLYSVQSLQTMKKLEQVNGNVAMTLDKLPAIRGDLVRTDPAWESWDFLKLTEALTLWTRRNPIDSQARDKPTRQPDDNFRKRDSRPLRVYHAQQKNQQRTHLCAYCDEPDHKSSNCQTVKTASERKKVLAQKRLCFNCARPSHRASECTSKITCQNCSRKHHTSICDTKPEEPKEKMLGAHKTDDADVVYPVVLVEVEGIITRALLDTGAGGSYASAKLIKALRKQPVETKTKKIEMMIASTTTKVEIYNAEVKSIDGKFNMNVNFTKVHKPELLWVENPRYKALMSKYSHLEGVHMDDDDTKNQLPIHLVLGAAEYSRIKTENPPRVGGEYEPVGELTKLGWVLMAPGQEFDRDVMLLTQTSQADYDQLCRLDVLGLQDSAEHDQQTVFTEFKEQLQRDPEGWYETALPWKGNHAPLPTNEQNSLRRLDSLTRKLQRNNIAEDYHAIIEEQKYNGVVEPADQPAKGKEFYIPHKAVIRESAETTKMRIVYDASARASPNAPSLNECLYPGPSLQNKLWDVLIRQRAYPVVITGDIQKAFLQIRIRESERDALRFHWRREPSAKLETLRFTRALFGLAPSPFLLGGVIECHLDAWKETYPEFVAELRRSLYVDDLLIGGQTIAQAKACKEKATEILGDATFRLHKWNSNERELEVDSEPPGDHDELTYAKQKCGVKPDESKLLGLLWKKKEDTMTVVFPRHETAVTKRGVLSELAKFYDPLGLVSPLTLKGKLIYRDICNAKTAWDAELGEPLRQHWIKWKQSLPPEEKVPRSIVDHREPVLEWELHAFGDASAQGVGAATYAVVRQEAGTTQRLIAAKGRLAKQGLTIPRLELIAGHMAKNLLINVREALSNLPTPKVYAWLDSTVALHWILGHGEYRQFVQNRVQKIQQHPEIIWKHVPTSDNPADLASRGGPVSESSLWWNGPEWLQHPDQWPPNPVLEPTKESQAEAKITKEVFACVIQTSHEADAFDQLLEAHDLRRALRVGAWVVRFVHNCKAKNRRTGPLMTEEIQNHRHWWFLRVQKRSRNEPSYNKDKLQLNLQPNQSGEMECRGRIQGHYPIFLPDTALFTEKLVQRTHVETLHGGVGLTIATLREKYWIPRLRRLAKRIIHGCWGCKRFRAIAASSPPPGLLPIERTQGTTPFQTIGVDFAGPIKHRVKAGDGKAYLVLFACSLTRALYLEILTSLATSEFLQSLKRLIARRGRPQTIYSDNGSTFIKAAKWLRKARRDELLQGFLADHEITWRFNLSRAPWWGGQFERLIGVVKQAFHKMIGGGKLTLPELRELALDTEVALNGRPLSYLEDDVQYPVLTPATMMFQRPNKLPEPEPDSDEELDLRKRARFLSKCKDAVWKRWTAEYMRALRERHNLNHKQKPNTVKEGDVVIIKSEEKNRGKWQLGIVNKLYPGRDGVVRAVKLRAGRSHLERPIQHLFPLELACDNAQPTPPVEVPVQLNPEAQSFRPKRKAAAAAKLRIQEIAEEEH